MVVFKIFSRHPSNIYWLLRQGFLARRLVASLRIHSDPRSRGGLSAADTAGYFLREFQRIRPKRPDAFARRRGGDYSGVRSGDGKRRVTETKPATETQFMKRWWRKLKGCIQRMGIKARKHNMRKKRNSLPGLLILPGFLTSRINILVQRRRGGACENVCRRGRK